MFYILYSGWTSNPLNAIFSSSKVALESLVDTLRIELDPWNISISLLECGCVDTRFYSQTLCDTLSLEYKLDRIKGRLYSPLISNVKNILNETFPLSVGYTTRSIADALFNPRPRTRYFVGWDARATWILRGILPDRMLDALWTCMMSEDVVFSKEKEYTLH